MPRVIRKMDGVIGWEKEMEYPYESIGTDGYSLEDIYRPIVTETSNASAGNFPKNIKEHFWIRPGVHDGDSWYSCGQLTNNNYFFYSASCDYTGFDCQGGMNLWVSSSWDTLVNHGMGSTLYRLYLQQTQDVSGLPTEEVICCYCEKDPGTMPDPFTEDCGRLCEHCYSVLKKKEEKKRYSTKQSSRW